LIEAAPKIVADLDTRIGSYVMDNLKNAGIDVRLRSRVTHAWKNGIEINNNENILAGIVIWASGVVVNPRIAELKVAKDRMGRVMVNEYLEVSDFPGVYAAGDCVHIKDPKSGHPIPPLAHTAVRQARVVAKNVLADIRGLSRKTYHYSKPPDLINLGTYKAVFRFRFVRLYGFLARFILTVAYLLLITGMPNRIRIVTDWLLSLTFGRDTTILRNNWW
jgi:NADH dehydrogenase